jgi:hypothetical protein
MLVAFSACRLQALVAITRLVKRFPDSRSLGAMDGDIAAGMLARASEIREDGEHIGLFEFLLWSHLRHRPVNLLFGSNLVDLTEVVGFPLPHIFLENPMYVCGVRMSASGRWLSAAGADVRINHYLIAFPLDAPDETSSGTNAVAMARRAGFTLKATEACGNCGIDCMTEAEGTVRSLANWMELRGELADLLETIAGDADWQAAFSRCGERPADDIGAMVPSSSSSSTSVAGGGMGPPTKAPAAALAASPFAASLAASLAAAPPAAIAVEPLAVEPIAVAFAAAPPAALAAEPSDELLPPLPLPPLPPPAGQHPTFTAHLKSQPQDDTFRMIKDYHTFMRAQEVWEALNLQPSRRQGVQKTGLKRQNRTSTLTHRMATAAAYRQWRDGPGATTRDHLKAWACYRKQSRNLRQSIPGPNRTQ